jgi:antitoxin MazE
VNFSVRKFYGIYGKNDDANKAYSQLLRNTKRSFNHRLLKYKFIIFPKSRMQLSSRSVEPQTDLTWVFLQAILRISKGGGNMVTKIQKWGNSQGLRLAKRVLEDANISVGDKVDVTARDGVIVIAPVRRVRGKRSLQELVSRIPKNYESAEIDWGEPVGREAW